MEELVIDYLKKTGLKFPEEQCEKLITSHPDYPAIISVADTFDQLGIEYVVGRKNEKNLAEITYPYMVHMNPHSLIIINDEADYKKVASHLKHEWSGIVIKVDEGQELEKETVRKAAQKEKDKKLGAKALIGLGAVALLAPMLSVITLPMALWLITALMGLAVGLVLASKELGLTGSKVEEFCKSGKNSDCTGVLKSDAATIWKGIKLTDMVNGYFAAQLAALLLIDITGVTTGLTSLALISVLVLPMIIYSYYYQGVVTKKWCKLCLLVTAVLLMQGALALSLYKPFALEATDLAPSAYVSVLILLFIGLATSFKAQWQQTKDLAEENNLAMRIVKSPTAFNALMAKEPYARPQEFRYDMLVGNAEAGHSLYLSLNLNCNPCSKTFDKLYEVMQDYSHKLKVHLTFAPNSQITEGFSDNEYFTQLWLEQIQGTANETAKTLNLLHAWYNKVDAGSFRKQYPLKSEDLSAKTLALIDEQVNWNYQNGVKTAPTMFFNMRHLPPYYRMDMLAQALPYILNELPVPDLSHVYEAAKEA